MSEVVGARHTPCGVGLASCLVPLATFPATLAELTALLEVTKVRTCSPTRRRPPRAGSVTARPAAPCRPAAETKVPKEAPSTLQLPVPRLVARSSRLRLGPRRPRP